MIGLRLCRQTAAKGPARRRIGTPGRVYLLVWTLVAVFLSPPSRFWPVAALCLLVAALFHSESLKRLFHPRWLLLLGLIALPSLFLPGEPLVDLGAVTLTREGLLESGRMASRAFIVVAAIEGFTASVSISEMAGLFERAGLRGLGFAVGVALNLLPILRESIAVTWHGLRMRGALRRSRLRSLRYFLVTVGAGAVQRAEEIALAAEARAYSPDRAQPAPLRRGSYDALLMLVTLLLLLALLL